MENSIVNERIIRRRQVARFATHRSKNAKSVYRSSDILPEYGLRNFLGSREGSRAGVEGGKGFRLEKLSEGGGEERGRRRQKTEAGRRRYDTVRPWRTDVETIEARYTSESLFALMAYVWKREGW